MYFRTPREPIADDRALAEARDADGRNCHRAAAEAQERARAEAALRASEERRRVATHAAQTATFDIALGIRRGRLRPQHGCAAVRGPARARHPRPQDPQQLMQQWLRPADARRHAELLQATMRGEGDLRNELLVRNPATGAEYWIEAYATLVRDAGGRPDRVVGIMRNVTERKRAEAATRGSEERLRHVRDGMGEAFGVLRPISPSSVQSRSSAPRWPRPGGDRRALTLGRVSREPELGARPASRKRCRSACRSPWSTGSPGNRATRAGWRCAPIRPSTDRSRSSGAT